MTNTTTRLLTVAGAVIAAMGVWLIAVPLAGLDLVATPIGGPAMSITALTVGVTSLLAGLAGLGLLAIMQRRSEHARRNWTGVAAAVLVLSLASPLGGATAAVKLTLIAMHLVVGAVLIAGMRASAR